MTTHEAPATTVKLEWLDLKADAGMALLADALEPEKSEAAKVRALARFGITRGADDDSYLAAWLRAMHERNGLTYRRPADSAIAGAVLQGGSSLSRWIWWLA